jgi:hypothetical protein
MNYNIRENGLSFSIIPVDLILRQFKNYLEKDIMCELLNLDTENKNYLSILDEGQCIIRVKNHFCWKYLISKTNYYLSKKFIKIIVIS